MPLDADAVTLASESRLALATAAVAKAVTAREIELFVASGVPASAAIAAATATNAEILGMQDRLGRIRPGFEADLIAVGGDPAQDVTKLRTVSFVMKAGMAVRTTADTRRRSVE